MKKMNTAGATQSAVKKAAQNRISWRAVVEA